MINNTNVAGFTSIAFARDTKEDVMYVTTAERLLFLFIGNRIIGQVVGISLG